MTIELQKQSTEHLQSNLISELMTYLKTTYPDDYREFLVQEKMMKLHTYEPVYGDYVFRMMIDEISNWKEISVKQVLSGFLKFYSRNRDSYPSQYY